MWGIVKKIWTRLRGRLSACFNYAHRDAYERLDDDLKVARRLGFIRSEWVAERFSRNHDWSSEEKETRAILSILMQARPDEVRLLSAGRALSAAEKAQLKSLQSNAILKCPIVHKKHIDAIHSFIAQHLIKGAGYPVDLLVSGQVGDWGERWERSDALLAAALHYRVYEHSDFTKFSSIFGLVGSYLGKLDMFSLESEGGPVNRSLLYIAHAGQEEWQSFFVKVLEISASNTASAGPFDPGENNRAKALRNRRGNRLQVRIGFLMNLGGSICCVLFDRDELDSWNGVLTPAAIAELTRRGVRDTTTPKNVKFVFLSMGRNVDGVIDVEHRSAESPSAACLATKRDDAVTIDKTDLDVIGRFMLDDPNLFDDEGRFVKLLTAMRKREMRLSAQRVDGINDVGDAKVVPSSIGAVQRPRKPLTGVPSDTR